MSERYNSVIVAGRSVEERRKALLEALERRGWCSTPQTTSGARHVRLWRATEGFVVIQLDASWDEADGDLARALSKTGGEQVAAAFFSSAGELEEVALFDGGKAIASSSQSDAAGVWEVHAAANRTFSKEWSASEPDEVEWESALRGFSEAQRTSFGSGPLSSVLQAQRWHALTPDTAAAPVELSFAEPHRANTLTLVERALAATVAPLLSKLGLVAGKAESWTDDVALAWERPVGDRKLRVQYEFGKEHVFRIRQRFEFLARDERHSQWVGSHVDLGSRDVEQFQPARSDAHLDRACRFLAASLARDWMKVADLAPPFRAELEAASSTDEWRRAAASYDDLWRTRLVSSERGPEWTPALIVFKGAKTLLVETTQKERFTFAFDTALAPHGGAVAVGGIWEMSGGGSRARRLKVGDRTFSFDEAGVFQASG